MNKYVSPVVALDMEISEGVFLASGAIAPDGGVDNTAASDIKCDSIYMKGVWQAPDYSDWAGTQRGYRQQFACLGCPANTDNGCGLLTHYIDSNNAASYTVDNGNRKPSWEKKGYSPDDIVSDWNM